MQVEGIEFTGLREWLFPDYYKPRMNPLRISGERSYETGVTAEDGSVHYQALPDGMIKTLSEPTRTMDQCKAAYFQNDIELIGGLPCIESWQTLFFGLGYPYTLDMIERGIAQYNCMPIVWDYPNAVRKRITEMMEEAKRVGKDPKEAEQRFEAVHGYDLSNYLEMPHVEVREIGRSDASKKAGIKSPDWELWHVHPNGTHEVLIEVPKVPFTKGRSAFLIYLGPSIYNPQRREYMAIGGRGPDTEVANALYLGRKVWYREPPKDKPHIPPEYWAIEGIEDLADTIWKFIHERTEPYHAIEIAATTQIDSGKVVMIEDLLGIEFLRLGGRYSYQ